MGQELYIIAGIFISLLFIELAGVSPGGIIVPGYIALSLQRPQEALLTAGAALCITLVIKLLSRFFFVFGRRRFALSILLGLTLKLFMEHFIAGLPVFQTDVRIIGWLIPGIIANDMLKQGMVRTTLAMGAVSSLTLLAVMVLQ
ncbi:poly-gamma-glutamate biosynthesis protein PgsC [Spirochaetia bacterium]|nr:poly-gamma-glutamate biosynthesis protein PgsC [Spirochaetia bacterium]